MAVISIIVPVYNVEKYLSRCLDSILAQSFQSFDVILVDDGSPDNCGKICDEYATRDNRVNVIHQVNQGLSEARNVGIEWAMQSSDSNWITFVDSDDWLHRDYLKLLYEAVLENKVELSICNCIKTAEDSISEDIVLGETRVFSPEDFWCFRQYGGAWAKLYKKEHFNDIRYPKGLLYEDIFVTYRLLFMQEKLVYLEAPLYNYYLRDDSITKSAWTPRVMAQLDGMRQQIRYFRDNGYESAFRVTVRNYLLDIRKQIDEAKNVKLAYMREYVLLHMMYRLSLIKYHIPVQDNTNLYRVGFPLFTWLYKKWTYFKEIYNAK